LSSPSSSSNVRPHVFAPFSWPKPVQEEAAETAAVAVSEPEPEPEPEPVIELPDVEAITAAAREEGHQEGFEAGYQEGLSRAQEEQAALLHGLAALAENAVHEVDQLVRGLEPQVVELGLAIAEKVIEREVRLDPTIVVGVVRATLAEISETTTVNVRVSPDDHEILLPHWDGMLPKSVAQRSELLSDEAVAPGGCVVETRVGRVDAQLKSKLQQIATTFHALLEGEPV
jgi:flagellar assembly protein FliH